MRARGRRVQHGGALGRDAQQGAPAGDVLGGGTLVGVGAGAAELEGGVPAGEAAFVDQRGVGVAGQAQVPGVDVGEDGVDVGPGRVQAGAGERQAVEGVQQDLPAPGAHRAAEAGVGDQVAGAGQRGPPGEGVRGEAGGLRRHGVGECARGGPGGAGARRPHPERGLQRAGVAAVGRGAVPRGEEREVAGGQQPLRGVVGAQQERAGGAEGGAGRTARATGGGQGEPQGAPERDAAAADHQVTAACARPRGRRPRHAVAAVVVAGAAQELAVGAGRQPVGALQDGEVVVRHAVEQQAAPVRQGGPGVEEGEDPVVLREDVEVLPARGAEDVAQAALAVVEADPVQGGQGGGGQQGRVGEGGVLVAAVREAELLPLHVVPAVGLVPDDHQQIQQTGPVVEREGGGAVLAQLGGEPVAHGGAVQPEAGVVVDQHVRVAGALQPLGDRPQGVRGEGVVPVEEDQVVARRPLHARVAGRSEPGVALQVDGADPVVAGGELVDDRPAPVRGPVVDRDQLQVRVRLPEHRLQAGVQVRLDLVRGHDDTEPGQRHIQGVTGAVGLGRRADGTGTGRSEGVTWIRLVALTGGDAGRVSGRPVDRTAPSGERIRPLAGRFRSSDAFP